jgi:hypothetical protein
MSHETSFRHENLTLWYAPSTRERQTFTVFFDDVGAPTGRRHVLISPEADGGMRVDGNIPKEFVTVVARLWAETSVPDTSA